MFDYPGSCFGSFDRKAKECRKCLMGQYCEDGYPQDGARDSGMSRLEDLLRYGFDNIMLDGSIAMCEKKNGGHWLVAQDADGSVTVSSDGKSKSAKHLRSKERAEEFFRECCEDL